MKSFLFASRTVMLAVFLGAVALGCARAAKDTTGYAIQDNITVQAPFDEAWQAMKGVLREQGYDIYTRDKRGIFVAYSETDRRMLRIVPNRMKYTIEMASVSSDETKVYIETVKQVYGTTLMTYPDWHDRQAENNGAAMDILNGLQAKLGGGSDLAPAESVVDSETPEIVEIEEAEEAEEATPTI